MQKFFSEPHEDGKYYVVSKNLLTGEMEEKPIAVYPTESEAKQRAHELNEEYNRKKKENENNETMNKDVNKIVKIILYVVGIIFVLVSLVEYSNRDHGGINASASVLEAVYWLIAGCTSLIMGHLTALIDKIHSNHKDEQENS